MIEIYNIIEEWFINFFKRTKTEKQFFKLINNIKKETLALYIKEKGPQENNDHNWEYFFIKKYEKNIHQESLKLMQELNLTFYFEDDAMGAQFYTVYKDNVSIGTNVEYYSSRILNLTQEESLLYFLFKYKEKLNSKT
jgi:hypothetical protein